MALERIIEAMPDPQHDYPSLFIGHLSVLGTFLKADSALKIGWDVAVRPELFKRFTYAALGHIHRQQRVTDNVWYAGRPMQAKFEEEGRECGWLIVDLSQDRPVSVTPVASNIARFVSWQYPVVAAEPDFDGAYVRITFAHDTSEFQRQAARQMAIDRGAREVFTVTEPRPRIERARAEVSVDITPVDAMAKLLELRGLPLEPYLSAGKAMLEGEQWIPDSDSDTDPKGSPERALEASRVPVPAPVSGSGSTTG
jgi:DNA repair exonuclease SbcCD nuclease subunit